LNHFYNARQTDEKAEAGPADSKTAALAAGEARQAAEAARQAR
jgi:hypothetical protein